jgi:tetratricopeptide (TPR) repeat protein
VIWESTLSPDHPDLARALTNLAAFYCSTGRYTPAEPMFRRALAIAENSLGPENRLVGKILAEYAVLLRKTKQKRRSQEDGGAVAGYPAGKCIGRLGQTYDRPPRFEHVQLRIDRIGD